MIPAVARGREKRYPYTPCLCPCTLSFWSHASIHVSAPHKILLPNKQERCPSMNNMNLLNCSKLKTFSCMLGVIYHNLQQLSNTLQHKITTSRVELLLTLKSSTFCKGRYDTLRCVAGIRISNLTRIFKFKRSRSIHFSKSKHSNWH